MNLQAGDSSKFYGWYVQIFPRRCLWHQESKTDSNKGFCQNRRPEFREWMKLPAEAYRRAGPRWWLEARAVAKRSLQWNSWSMEQSTMMSRASLLRSRKMLRSWHKTSHH